MLPAATAMQDACQQRHSMCKRRKRHLRLAPLNKYSMLAHWWCRPHQKHSLTPITACCNACQQPGGSPLSAGNCHLCWWQLSIGGPAATVGQFAHHRWWRFQRLCHAAAAATLLALCKSCCHPSACGLALWPWCSSSAAYARRCSCCCCACAGPAAAWLDLYAVQLS